MREALQGGNGFFLPKIGAGFAAALGGLGLVLALIGIYGVISCTVTQRTHEVGVRMALGAQRLDIVKMVLGQGLALVLAGVGAGVLTSLAMARVVSTLLFGVSATDPITFLGVSLLFGAMALLACWIPARRASRLPPTTALRGE